MIYIETERLILRSWKPEDLPLFIAMNKDVRVMRYFPAILNDSETEAFYRRIHTGFDLIYTPWETRFMKLVRENGGQAYNGLKMLLYQGVIAYELWNGVEVSEKEAQIVYEKLKSAVS